VREQGSYPLGKTRTWVTTWVPSEVELDVIIAALGTAPTGEDELKRFLIHILGKELRQKNLAAIIPQLDWPGASRQAAIDVLVASSSKQAVDPLLAKLDDSDKDFKRAVIDALGQLGDKQAVVPLLSKLDESDKDIRQAIIRALGQLGDKQAVPPLLARLDDSDSEIRQAVIETLGQLGDTRANAPLLTKLAAQDANIGTSVAAALQALGEPKGATALKGYLTSENAELRRTAVRAYACQRDPQDQRLLSMDLDGTAPWLDPQEVVAEVRIGIAARLLSLNADQIRSRYEALMAALGLNLSWKS